MATVKASSRYSSIDSHSSSTSGRSSSTSTSSLSNKKSTNPPVSGSKPRYQRSDSVNPAKGTTSQAITCVKSTNPQSQNLGSLLRKLIDKRSTNPKKHGPLVLPPDPIAKDIKGSGKSSGGKSNMSALSKKLFQKGSEKKALTEVKNNTRTLAMVLRSERELLAQNKEYEDEICELRLLLEERNYEIEKLKDLCLKQREEIKALKDAVLFPEETNMQMQELMEKQGEELKQAKQVIPTLQREVSSLTAHLHCLALDLAQVKAEKLGTSPCVDGLMSSPRTPILYGEEVATYPLDYNASHPRVSECGSSDDLFLKDFNPCLTPRFSKKKLKVYDGSS